MLLVLASMYNVYLARAKPVEAAKTEISSRNAQDVLDMIEETLTYMADHRGSQSRKGANLQSTDEPSEWPWIDSLLDLYAQYPAVSDNVSEGVISIILQHYAINEHFRKTVIKASVTSEHFLNFTLQEFPVVKDGLLQWFFSDPEFRQSVYKDISCSQVSDLLKLFASSLPTQRSDTSPREYSREQPFAWKVMEKWSENDCFKSALLERLVISKPFQTRVEKSFSNSKAFSEAIVLGFISSQFFVTSLVEEYVKSQHLMKNLEYQYKNAKIFRDFLLQNVVEDKTYREAIFDHLSKDHIEAKKLEFKKAVLKQAVESEKFRTVLFEQIRESDKFRESVLEAFSNIHLFQRALVKLFASSEYFKKEVRDSQAMLSEAMELFEQSEPFRNAVLKTRTIHVRM